jgi:hypothetical protein
MTPRHKAMLWLVFKTYLAVFLAGVKAAQPHKQAQAHRYQVLQRAAVKETGSK